MGICDTFYCDQPVGYPIPGEGHEPYPRYVDLLVEDIDKDPGRKGRPLVLLAHGWGAPHALALATRLGPRVVKVYIIRDNPPLMPGGLPSFYDDHNKWCKQAGNSILEWLRVANPNALFETACKASPKELKKMFAESPYFTRVVNYATLAFRDGIYPDMSKDIQVISSPMCVITPKQNTPDGNPDMTWILWTSGPYNVYMIDDYHHACVRPRKKNNKITEFPLGDLLIRDMIISLQGITWRHLRDLSRAYWAPGVNIAFP